MSEVESGRMVHVTRHGRRVAAIVPEPMAESVDARFAAISRSFSEKHRNLLDRLADL